MGTDGVPSAGSVLEPITTIDDCAIAADGIPSNKNPNIVAMIDDFKFFIFAIFSGRSTSNQIIKRSLEGKTALYIFLNPTCVD